MFVRLSRSLKKRWTRSAITLQVQQATSPGTLIPSASQLNELSSATYPESEYPLVLEVVLTALDTNSTPERVHSLAKTLDLILYLLRHGGMPQVAVAFRRYTMEFAQLCTFAIFDRKDEQCANRVHEKAKRVHRFLTNRDALAAERDAAKLTAGKYLKGISSSSSSSSNTSTIPEKPVFHYSSSEEEEEAPEEEEETNAAIVIVHSHRNLIDEESTGQHSSATFDPFGGAVMSTSQPILIPPVVAQGGLLRGQT